MNPEQIERGEPSEIRRFSGIEHLYGRQGLNRLQAAHVTVAGLGGVGSWAVESLVRTAIGALKLIDLDVVSPSNINRQLLAITDTFGKSKVEVMAERALQINPSIRIEACDDYLSRDNIEAHIPSATSFVVDCIDDFRVKAALIHHCHRNRIPIVSVGGAGGQRQPGRIGIADFSQSRQDVLLARTRKLLRTDYGFPIDVKKKFNVPCVSSDEQPRYGDGSGGISYTRPKKGAEFASRLSCAGLLGSVTHVTACFGLHASAHVVNTLVDQMLVEQKE